MDNLAKALSELLEQIECLRDIEFSLDVEPYKAEANWDDAVRRAQDALLQANEVKRLSNPVDDGAVEREWQPIETAPKDGTEILAGYFGKPSGRFYFELIRWLDGKWLCRNGISSYANYWQPLQSPAALEAAEPHP